jgi:hypothetical protein
LKYIHCWLFLSLVWDFLFFLFMFIINPCVCTFIVMFRLFQIMDPKNGEISRSMRNRGVEICLLSPRIDVLYDVTLSLQNREDCLVYCSFTRSCDNKLVTWIELNCQIWFHLIITITDLSFPFFFIEGEKLIQKTILFYRIDKFKLSFLTKDTNYHQRSTSEIWYIGPISHENNNNNVVLVLQMPSIRNSRSVSSKPKSHKVNRIPYKTSMKKIFDFSKDTIELFLQDCILGISFFIEEILFPIHKQKD